MFAAINPLLGSDLGRVNDRMPTPMLHVCHIP